MREIIQPRLDQRTTIRLGGTALAELVLEQEEDFCLLEERLRHWGGRPFCIGAGSNLLPHDGELSLVLVRPALNNGPTILAEENGRVLVQVGAGVPLPRLIRFCATEGLAGIAGLVGIPGTVGGAIAMNAGSFGVETCRQLHSIRIWQHGRVSDVSAQDLAFSYRQLRLKKSGDPFFILSGIFVLTRTERNVITTELRHDFFQKKSKQPVTAHSAGCVFKNPPEGPSAGILLDQAGFRGKRLGGMAFSEMHANFLINEGKGSAEAAFALIDLAREAIRQRYGIELELEVKVVS